MLLALPHYSVPGFPLYEDTDLGRATAHQLYCFAIEVGFGANALPSRIGKNKTGTARDKIGTARGKTGTARYNKGTGP